MANKIFEVECSEVRIFSWTLEVVAESVEEAESRVYEMYQDGFLHGNGADNEETENGLEIDSVKELEVTE